MSDDTCPVRWCEEPKGHEGAHVAYVLDVPVTAVTGKGPTILQLLVTGTTRNDRHLELIVSNGVVGRVLIPWPTARVVGSAMIDAARRYAA